MVAFYFYEASGIATIMLLLRRTRLLPLILFGKH